MELLLFFIGIIFALGCIAAGAHWLHQRNLPEGAEESEVNPVDMECCGQHEVCEKESLLAAISKDVEYYNDEELDAYRGRQPEDYNEEETEEFRNVLYTMRDDEVAGWVRSLQLRQVELPAQVKDEVLLIVGERRGQ